MFVYIPSVASLKVPHHWGPPPSPAPSPWGRAGILPTLLWSSASSLAWGLSLPNNQHLETLNVLLPKCKKLNRDMRIRGWKWGWSLWPFSDKQGNTKAVGRQWQSGSRAGLEKRLSSQNLQNSFPCGSFASTTKDILSSSKPTCTQCGKTGKGHFRSLIYWKVVFMNE